MTPRFVVLVTFAAGILVPGCVSGQTKDPSPARTLNGHTFIPSVAVRDPFITTLVRTQTGGGIATNVSRDIENEAVDSLIDALTGDLAFLTLEFEYQHGVTDWLALRASGGGGARLGTGAQSVLAEGVTSSFNFEFGATARVLQKEKWLLSGTLRLAPSTQYRLDILGFVKRAIEEGEVSEDNSVIVRSEGIGGAVGLGGAYAPTPWLGLIFRTEAGYSDTFSPENRGDLAWAFGGLASFDLNPLSGVPIGLIVSAEQDGFVLANSDITDRVRSFGWGIAYTGRNDFSLSLEASRSSVPLLKAEKTISANLISFNIRYFF